MVHIVSTGLFVLGLLLLVIALLTGSVGYSDMRPPRPGDSFALDDRESIDYLAETEKQHSAIGKIMRSKLFTTGLLALLISMILGLLPK